MNELTVARCFQNPKENILMDIGILAKNTPDLLDLSIGDPDLNTDSKIIEYVSEKAKEGETHYTLSDGSTEFLDEVIHFYKNEYQLSFDRNQIRATVGVSHGLYLALLSIINPGDEVIIHEPFFSPYRDQVELVGGNPVIIPTFEKDNFELNPTILEKAITPKTKAIIINTPNNPTGAVFSRETMEAIAKIAIENNLFILSDEIYEKFCFYDEFTPMAAFAPNHTITLSGFSKAFAMTGWRIGYMISPAFVNDVARYLNENISYSANSLSQQAGIYALRNVNELVPPTVDVFKNRIEYIEERVKQSTVLEMAPIKGTMYAYINIMKTGLTSVDFAEKLLKEAKILVIPGVAFGVSTGEYHVRIAATQSVETIKEAFDRMSNLTF